VIRVDGVSVSFGHLQVLDSVDLHIESGELVGLVGPNGAGKTTLLRTINGLLDADEGDVWLDDRRVSQMGAREVSKTLATVPQNTHVGFSFRAEELVEMGRTPHRSRLNWSDDTDPVEQALERTETTHLRDRKAEDLSGGERQRILLARALAQEPAMLLLDEPTANLDINHQIQVLELVDELVEEGLGGLAAIHDLDLAARYCDRLVLLSEGTIQSRGRPEAVLKDARLAEAFETETAVTENPVTGTPTVTALETAPGQDVRVHVAGSGRGAVAAVRTLWREGFAVSLGPIPEGDVAADLARVLDVDVVTAPAFEQPDESRLDDARRLVSEADVVVVTAGPGRALVTDAIGSVPRIDAALASEGTAVARVDGGETAAVQDESRLAEAVLEAMSR